MKYAISLLLILLTLPVASAQESPAALAAKLGSKNYLEREKAARALESLGKPALAALRDALSTADLETKRRAILLMDRIEDRVMQEELMAPRMVRLRFQDAPIESALRDVEKQLGLPFSGYWTKDSITLDTGAMPSWQAWQRFCAAGKIEEADYARAAAKLKRMTEDDVNQLMTSLNRNAIEIRPVYSPPRMEFARFLTSAGYRVDDRHSVRVRVKWHSLGPAFNAKERHATFAIEVRPEPRLEIASIPRAEITKIVADDGNPRAVQAVRLFPETAHVDNGNFLAGYVGEVQYGGLLHLQSIPWTVPDRRFKELHGRVRMDVVVRPRMIEIAHVHKAIGKQASGFQGVTLKVLEAEVTDEGNLYLRLHLSNLESLTPQTADQQVVRVRPGVIAVRGAVDVAMERLELYDSSGRKRKQIKARYEQSGKGKSYEAEIVFETVGMKTDGLTLVMTKAPRTVALEVPFMVRDLAWTGDDEGKKKPA